MEEIVTITDYDHQGRGIGRINNKIIFIPKVMVGEKVKVKITIDKKKFMVGEVIELIEKNPKRVKNICPYYDECGGCDLLHLPYDEQLKYKQDKIKNIIGRYVDQNITIKNIIPSVNQFHYRNKVTLHVNHEKIGLYNKKSNKIVKLDNCLLLDKPINNYLKKIDANKYKNRTEIILRTNGKDILDKQGQIIKKIGDYQYYVSLNSFFQINDEVTKDMYDKIKEYANANRKDNVLDLYCGTGTIGLYLSKDANRVLGIEINKQAIDDAIKNKELNKVDNIDFIASDVSAIINDITFTPTIIVVDPPRAGLDEKAIKTIIKMHPNKLIYTSCDPMTLARDLKVLKDYFKIEEITPFDMFPNTYHVECVCLLTSKK